MPRGYVLLAREGRIASILQYDVTLDVNGRSRLRTVIHSRRLTVMGLYICSSLSRIPSSCFFRSSWNFLSSLEFGFVSGSACQTGYGGKFSFRYGEAKKHPNNFPFLLIKSLYRSLHETVVWRWGQCRQVASWRGYGSRNWSVFQFEF